MAQPTPYVKSQTFADVQSGNTLVPIPGSDFDTEFSLIQATLDQTLANLELIQRDDGSIANGVVTPDSLDTATLLMMTEWTPRGAWLTATVYSANDVVTQSSNSYVCLVDHTAGTFATDLAAGKWMALFNSVAASAVAVTPGGALVATTVQAALIELDSDLSAEITARAAAITALTATVTANAALVTSTYVPLTTRGDLLSRGASANSRLAVGTTGQVLGTDGTDVMWVTPAAVQGVPVGLVAPYAGATAPTSWLLCYGQAISRTGYSSLYAAIGTVYGVGDGATTFNVPDLRGRVPAGADAMGGVAASRLGGGVTGGVTAAAVPGVVGGAQSHTLTAAQIPAHTHGIPGTSTAPTGAGAALDRGVDTGGGTATVTTDTGTGGGTAHNVTQPTLVMNYIIKATS